MYQHETQIRVRYAETDKMGYVYYGNYCQYYEIGRVETLRSLGTDYANLEHEGYMLPVIHLDIQYFKPAFYDELLTIITSIKTLPNVKIHFDYEIKNAQSELLNKGSTTLVFVDAKTRKPVKAPQKILNQLAPYFQIPLK